MEREMQYVYEVYLTGSFSKAARNLFVSQPALSTAIKRLESELKTPLFDRSTNPIRLTEAGEFYIHSIEEIMEIEKKVGLYFNGLDSMEFGSISIASGSFFCSYALPLHFKPFLERYPGITVSLTENNSHEEMSEMLRVGNVDFVLTSTIEPYKGYFRQFFDKEQLILAVPGKFEVNSELREYQLSYKDILDGVHNDSDCPAISLTPFNNIPFISLDKRSELYQRTQMLFQNSGISPKPIMYLDQIMTAYYMVWHGYGFSIIRDSTLNIAFPSDGQDHSIVFYKIDDPLTTRDIYFFHKDPVFLTKASMEFLKYTQNVCVI